VNTQYFLTKQRKLYFKTPHTSYTEACGYGVFYTRKSSWTWNTQAIWNTITSHALWRKAWLSWPQRPATGPSPKPDKSHHNP